MNNPTDCQNRRQIITALVLGELEPQTADELKRHIDTCKTCESFYQTLVDEEETIRSTFEAIAQKGETIQDILIKQFAKRQPAAHRTDMRPRRNFQAIFSMILKSKMTKLAVAAAIILGAFLAIYKLGYPIDVTSVAWADVRDAFLAQSWVHLKYDNGAERWYNLKEGKHYYKDWDGRCVFVDRVLNIRQVYYSVWGEHISEDRPVIYEEGTIPPYQPKTAWELIVGHVEKMAEKGQWRYWESEKHIENVGGRQLVRFDIYYYDALGRRRLEEQLWADPETRLPVRIWKRFQAWTPAHPEKLDNEYTTGEFDFPESGPTSIYDLSVPRDLPVVRHYDKTPEAAVIEVIEAGKAALERFPNRYCAVRWDNTDEGSGIDVVWRNGEKVHNNHYFNLQADSPYPDYHLDLPANAEEVLSWVETQPPVSTYMFDGERQYSRQHRTIFSLLTESRVRVIRTRINLLPSSSRFIEDQWTYANRNPASVQMIDDVPEEMKRYIGLRIDIGDIRRDFYIDPEHDYICARWIWWKLRSGRWEKEREYECSGFTRLPEGQWYATKRILITYPDPKRGTVRGGANWNINVQALEEDEFPPDTFNGEKLLEDAKIKTY